MTIKEKIYQRIKEDIEKLPIEEKNKKIEHLKNDAYYQLLSVSQKFKDIFLDDLSLVDLSTLIEVEDLTLYLTVVLDELLKQIKRNRQD